MSRLPPKPGHQLRDERFAKAFDTSHLDIGLGRRMVHSALVSAGSAVLLMSVQIIQLTVLSRLLAPEDFGLIAMAMVVTGVVRLFSDLGLTMATIQREEITHDFVSSLFYIDVGFSIILMLLCRLAAPAAALIYSEPRVEMIIIAIAVTFPISALRSQNRALMARSMLYLRLNISTVAASIFGLAVTLVCAGLLNLGYWSIVVGTLAAAVLEACISWIIFPWRPGAVHSWAEARSATRFGLNLLGANLASWMWKQSDNALIGYRWDAAELGFYARAYSILMVPLTLVSGPIGGAVIPALSRLQNKKEEWTSLLFSTARIMAFFAGLMSVGLALNADFLVEALLGPNWGRSASIFYYLTISIFPGLVWELARFIFLSLGRTDAMLRYSIAAALIHVTAFAIGVQYGAEGVAIGLAIVSWLVMLPLLMFCCRISGLTLRSLIWQFLPSQMAMLLVWALTLALQDNMSIEGTLTETIVKSVAITTAYILMHIMILPFHAGWRNDAKRMLSWTQSTFNRMLGIKV